MRRVYTQFMAAIDKKFITAALGWGFLLWFIGYILGIVFFMFVPVHLLGWVLMPIGTLVTLWVLCKKIPHSGFNFYIQLGISWTVLAIVLDYFFIVQLLQPADGYYKPDVYVYYLLTFLLPLLVGKYKAAQVSR